MLLAIRRVKTINLIIYSVFLAGACLWLTSGRVHAATLTVDTNCTLSEAINAVNNGSDADGCVATGSYGTDDTINLPAGTTNLTADLPRVTSTHDLTVAGAGKNITTIDAHNFEGFQGGGQHTAFTFKDFTLVNATVGGILVSGDNQAVTIQNIEVANSARGVAIDGTHLTVVNSYFHDNESYGFYSGLAMLLKATASTDSLIASITNTVIDNNTGVWGGLDVSADQATAASMAITLSGVTANHNVGQDYTTTGGSAPGGAGIAVEADENPAHLQLSIDATTVAYNTVTGTADLTSTNPFGATRIVGFEVGVANLNPGLNFTNVTVAYNQVTDSMDNALGIAGFMGLLIDAPETPSLVNITVVGNTIVRQTPAILGRVPAFTFIKMISSPQSVFTGASAQNSLVAHNTYNDSPNNCRKDMDMSSAGISEPIDLTPVNNGHNMSDDQTCTGFQYIPTLYDTIDHEVKDNGGPVPTIALHSDSPAVNGGAQVLGISTDARGIARNGYYSVGAYQGQLLAASTENSNGGTLATTGVAVSTTLLLGLIIASGAYVFFDYQKHKRPLIEADPNARYTLGHHVRVVTLPLLKYRLSVRFEKKPTTIIAP